MDEDHRMLMQDDDHHIPENDRCTRGERKPKRAGLVYLMCLFNAYVQSI